ncbi:MAG: hypothetical protein ACOY9Y_11155 [Bacillota bacterium]
MHIHEMLCKAHMMKKKAAMMAAKLAEMAPYVTWKEKLHHYHHHLMKHAEHLKSMMEGGHSTAAGAVEDVQHHPPTFGDALEMAHAHEMETICLLHNILRIVPMVRMRVHILMMMKEQMDYLVFLAQTATLLMEKKHHYPPDYGPPTPPPMPMPPYYPYPPKG